MKRILRAVLSVLIVLGQMLLALIAFLVPPVLFYLLGPAAQESAMIKDGPNEILYLPLIVGGLGAFGVLRYFDNRRSEAEDAKEQAAMYERIGEYYRTAPKVDIVDE